jgi:hypothetical protein
MVYYGKVRITTTTVSVVEDGKKIYKQKVVTEHRPKEEWIGVPVPDSGIPPEMVDIPGIVHAVWIIAKF